MVAITLPDGSVREFDGSVSGLELATDIGPGLAKAALAIRMGGEMRDLSTVIDADAEVSIVTGRDDDALELFRHDTAHVMAEAVQEIYPGTQVTIGPAIENGFYYDFARDVPFTPEDLEKIEAKMKEIIKRDEPFVREVWDRQKAMDTLRDKGESYKVELIEAIPEGEDIGIYRQGDWFDVCRGPHMPSTGKIGKAFKLMKLAGAYWRGDSNNAMLQRIYGTAWATEKQLKQHLHMLEEAEKRDHRRLGREMSLFHIQEVATGSVFWHPKGWMLYQVLQNYMRGRLEAENYVEVNTPQLVDRVLWEDSGHWEKFREHMFTAESEDRILALKPMNCPCHVQIYKQATVSYRDLPIRMAEFGSCHRNEPSGALHGLMRVRAFTQDDAHIFCTEDQITSETIAFCDLLMSIYKELGFEDVLVKFSDRPEVRAGEDDVWDKAEQALEASLNESKLDWELLPGEGAFYGPKLEFSLKDCLGRVQQCGTIQLDFSMPERLGAKYIDSDNTKKTPVMLHRAVLGSVERFLGLLLEEYAGALPFWLAPMQIVVASITENQLEYVASVVENLAKNGLRVKSDLRNEKIGYKIREHSMSRIPYVLVCGDREVEAEQVAVRDNSGKNIGAMSVAEFLDMISDVK